MPRKALPTIDRCPRTKPEIVAIGMDTSTNTTKVTLAAIQAGVRGIYIEKPFCRTPAEADEIVAACEQHNVKLAVAHRIDTTRC